MGAFKLEPRPDSETLEQAVRDQQAFAQHNKFGTYPVPTGTNNTKKSAKDGPVRTETAALELLRDEKPAMTNPTTTLDHAVPVRTRNAPP